MGGGSKYYRSNYCGNRKMKLLLGKSTQPFIYAPNLFMMNVSFSVLLLNHFEENTYQLTKLSEPGDLIVMLHLFWYLVVADN